MVRVIFVPDDVLIVAHLQAKTIHVLFKSCAALIGRFHLLDRGFREYCIHGWAVVVIGCFDKNRPPRDKTLTVVS